MNKVRKYKQNVLEFKLFESLVYNIIFVFIFLLIIIGISGNNKIEDESKTAVLESTTMKTMVEIIEEKDDQDTVISSANVLNNGYISKWNEEESYLLAKIAMAEAEGESIRTKVLVILTVLNRVNSEGFPNTIREVIYEKNKNGLYQFSCISDGRWNNVEPNEECYLSLEIVSEMQKDVISNGALYFEACKGESWHSRNLNLICQSDNTRFYK